MWEEQQAALELMEYGSTVSINTLEGQSPKDYVSYGPHAGIEQSSTYYTFLIIYEFYEKL